MRRIDETGIIKVADFGLSKSVYDQLYFRQDANDSVKLPIKWLAVESIEDGVFSEKTDVVWYQVFLEASHDVSMLFIVGIWSDLLGDI